VWKHRKLVPCLGLLALAGCGEDSLGLAAIEDLGCASCHVIPGVAWPKGTVGPSLDGFGERHFIAGKLVNEPRNLQAFIRNATAVVPGGAMPPIAMSDAQASDIAGYLSTLRAD
jgi:cytochrome c1